MSFNPKSHIKERVSELERLVHKHPEYVPIPLPQIKVHPQMRKTFLCISELADNIYILGLLNPIILNKTTDDKYPDLVAGERRFRAYNYLIDNADKYVAEAMRKLPKSILKSEIKYNKIFNKLKKEHIKRFSYIPGFVFHDLSKDQRQAIQFAENSYEQVKPAEAAESYADSYQWMKRQYHQKGEELTIARFAKITGRGIKIIKNALKFVTLQPDIRTWAKEGKIKYGSALLLTKIEDPYQRKVHAMAIMAHRLKHDDAFYMIDHFLQEALGGQQNMFGTAKQIILEKKKGIREHTGKEIHRNMILSAQYFKVLTEIYPTLKEQGINVLRYDSVKKGISNFYKYFQTLNEYCKNTRTIEDNSSLIPKIIFKYGD